MYIGLMGIPELRISRNVFVPVTRMFITTK